MMAPGDPMNTKPAEIMTSIEHMAHRRHPPQHVAALHGDDDAPPSAVHPDADPRLLRAANRFRKFMTALDLNPADAHLQGTEWRVARAFRELFAGLDPANEPELRTFPNTDGYTDMVALTDIPFYSVCAHHFLPFFGAAHVAYSPGERLVGLSKLPRALEYIARRPQVQEALTEQLAAFLEARLHPTGVIVVIDARHLCLEMRGVQRPGVVTRTTAARGVFAAETWRRRAFDHFGRTRHEASIGRIR